MLKALKCDILRCVLIIGRDHRRPADSRVLFRTQAA